MTSDLTLDNLANLENSQRWLDLLETSKRYLANNNPQPAMGYYYQGIAFHELKNYKQAEESFNQSIKIDPNNPLVYNAKGVLYKDRKKYKEAIQQFDACYQLNPDFLNAQINKAQTYSLENKNEEALGIYNSILSKNPDLIAVLIFKGECLKELGRSEEAIRTYDQAISYEPNAADLHFNKGNIYALEDRNDQALTCFEKAAELDPEFPETHYHIGLINQKLGKNDEAVNNFKRAITHNTTSPLSYICLGQCYQQMGDNKSAERYYEEGILQFPNSPYCSYNYGIHKISNGNVNDGIQNISNAVNALDEPEMLKHQLQKNLQDIQSEHQKIGQSFNERLIDPSRVSVSYPGLVNGLRVNRENRSDIISNINILKKRAYDIDAASFKYKSISEDYDNLKARNPILYSYVSSFLGLQNNFINSSDFNIKNTSNNSLKLNVLQRNGLTPELNHYSNGGQAVDMIIGATGSHFSKGEFINQIRKSFAPTADGFDSSDALTTMTEVTLKKVQVDNSKMDEIENYDKNSASKKFVEQVIQQNPKLANSVKDASTAIALKDFILYNNYLASNADVSEFSARNYQSTFESAYTSGVFEDIKQGALTGGIQTFKSFHKKNERDMEVLLVMDNKAGAVSKSQFFVQVFISSNGPIPKTFDKNDPAYVQVFKSDAKTLETKLEFPFTILGKNIDDEKPDAVYLKVIIWKLKSNKGAVKKGEQNLQLKTITMNLARFMDIKQDKLLSSKTIPILIKGVRNG